ncbi:peptidase S8/S53 domain-containing protein [Catenaria anguillulae PL171]|uniref:Peptidase S8/S53 domain-containing protein n=1 Tax=Catenaria anguillulae PL171 TaxID=765915 RepID=A0A1Y2HGQ7_9FUNG|nr:peptidase S8/S53 domain-containing protein [Catenaria anguillulae PL171]
MKLFSVIASIGLTLLSQANTATAAPTMGVPPNVVPNQYIVTLKPTANLSQFTRAFKSEIARERQEPGTENGGVVPAFGHQVAIGPSFKAVVGVLTGDMVRRLKAHGQVASVEPDRMLKLLETTQLNPSSWGLARISSRTAGNQGNFHFADKQGEGVDVYVLDTGVRSDHVEFRGIDGGSRADLAFKAEPHWVDGDANGHGTIVAGIITGVKSGIAKRARVHSIKVMDNNGTLSAGIRGMEFVAGQIRKAGKTAVCNMSFASAYNPDSANVLALERAVAALVEAGCVVIKGAGNDRQDACNVVPARTPQGLTVAALAADGLSIDSSYSNFGRCVQIAAPGTNITSAWNDGGYKTSSGTSLATPHVAGAAALILGQEPLLKPQQVVDRILSHATQGAIQGDLKGTPNRIVYVGK